MDVFTECLIIEKVTLSPDLLDGNYKDNIINILKNRLEGKCSSNGYVMKGSVKIHKINSGTVQMVSLNGNVVFNVEIYIKTCLPMIGNVIKSTVKNTNRFGVLCEVAHNGETIVEIIVAKKSNEIQSEVDLDELKNGDVVNIEVLGRKFELHDKKISIIGKIVLNDSQNRVARKAQNIQLYEAINVDDALVEVEDIIGDDEEVDEEDEDDEEEEEEEEDDADDDDEDDEDDEEDEKDDDIEGDDIDEASSDEDDGSDSSSVSSDDT